jgi:putative phosphoribosyl transferase
LINPAYTDRMHAGRVLARELGLLNLRDLVVLAIPNGGVEVALPVAQALNAPLRLLLVRKIQIPGNTEAGFGAVGHEGTVVHNRPLMERLGLSPEQVKAQEAQALASLEERARTYEKWAQLPDLAQKWIVLVDDGIASGTTMEAAVRIVRRHRPAGVVVAAPTASQRAYELLSSLADRIVVPQVRGGLYFAVADAYARWYDVETSQVLDLLRAHESMIRGDA